MATGEAPHGSGENFPAFTFDEAGLVEAVDQAIKSREMVERKRRRMFAEPPLPEWKFDEMGEQVKRGREEVGRTAALLDMVAPRVEEGKSWAVYIKAQADTLLAADNPPQP